MSTLLLVAAVILLPVWLIESILFYVSYRNSSRTKDTTTAKQPV